MGRIFLAFLMPFLLALPVRGDTVRCAAVIFEDSPSRYTQALLDGLYQRDLRVTFLVGGRQLDRDPRIVTLMTEEGHELGLHGHSLQNMLDMSRRQIGSEIHNNRIGLPENPLFLCPPGGCCSDGVRQVAKTLEVSLLGWSVDARGWEGEDLWQLAETVKDGDIILLREDGQAELTHALQVIDALCDAGVQLMTVSELARHSGTSLQPGKTYRSFPHAH